MHRLLTPNEMAEADRLTIESGRFSGHVLMQRAGAAVAAVILERFPAASHVDVLCGPGNNGGDGYVIASLLEQSGVDVRLWRSQAPKAGTDAALAADACALPVEELSEFHAEPGTLVVDALFGAGLSKPLQGDYARVAENVAAARVPVVAVDLPSGVSGESGAAMGPAIKADATVTFFRKKPGHLLYPGRGLCGETIVADIGITPDVLSAIQPTCFENVPDLWIEKFPVPDADSHKYSRGHVGVFSGGPASTGAARLSAMAAARAGAGAVTVLSQANALAVNAMHLTSIILRKTDSLEDVQEFLADRKPGGLVFGPGLGTHNKVGDFGLQMIANAAGIVSGIVCDADAITVFSRIAEEFFAAARIDGAPAIVITPHEGEFGRLFPDLTGSEIPSKVARARAAAKRANATIVYKGPDTVIAAPDGRAAINSNGTPLLATAGSGDVLSGIIAAMLAQKMPAFEAASAAVWLHAEAAQHFGPGLIAEDLPLALLTVLRDLFGRKNRAGAF
jgi:hydroxyethylthiazole kinase-like uncharacterized protein yjeF